MFRVFLLLGALSAGSSVVLGALGAHAFQPGEAGLQQWFATALQYQQFHALALLLVGILLHRAPQSRWLKMAGWLMVTGTLCFSGNLYLRSLADVHALHAITPVGGAAFMAGWVCVVTGVWKAFR